MTETLTLMELGIDGRLAKTVCSTKPCGSMFEIVRRTALEGLLLARRFRGTARSRRPRSG